MLRIGELTFAILCVTAHAAQAKTVIRIGTLAPIGSSWELNLREGFKEIETALHKEVNFVIYGGGVLGDEGDMVRKIRLGAIQGGAFASMGASIIAPEISVLKLPYLFDGLDEVDHIRESTRDRFSRVIEQGGFKLLAWTDVGGLAQIFSKIPVENLEKFRKSKVWMWHGDPISVEAYKQIGVEGVPLEIPQVFGALKTGLVQTVGGTGLTVLALQWYGDLHYATVVNARYEPAFLMIELKTWNTLPEAARKLIEATIRVREPKIIAQIRADEDRAFSSLVKKGLKVTKIPDVEREGFREGQKAVWNHFAGQLYPRELLDFILSELEKYRRNKPAGPH